jgi:antitoxin component of MazEF toxin-antitoxin module
MKQIRAMVRKWGNSFGVILPKEIVDRESIREGIEINLIITPRNRTTVADLFELSKRKKLPKLKKSTKQIMREIDRQLWPE